MIFVIISEMFHRRISLSSVLLLLLVNFLSRFRSELMYISLPHRKYQVKPHSSSWFSAACAAAIVHRNHFFLLHQREKSSDSKVKFRQAINRCKRVLETAKRAYSNKTKKFITSQKLGSCDFWWIAIIVFSAKVYLLYLLYSTGRSCCLLHMIKQNCLLKIFLWTLILMTRVSLPVFPSITNLKLHNISIIRKMVRKVVMDLDLSKASCPNCIPVVVLKNWVGTVLHISWNLQQVS